MNKDFPRILTLLRKERGLSQKQAAVELGVTQALLSHYENGKRECGLDFLVRTADYFNVSVDYLLGRSPMSSGASIHENELPESAPSEKYNGDAAGLTVFFQKKLLTNSIEILYSLLIKAKNPELSKSVFSYLSLALYRCYRLIHTAGKDNDPNMFGIPEEKVSSLTQAALTIADIKGLDAARNGSEDEKLTSARIEQEYTRQAAALLSVVKSAESSISKLQ